MLPRRGCRDLALATPQGKGAPNETVVSAGSTGSAHRGLLTRRGAAARRAATSNPGAPVLTSLTIVDAERARHASTSRADTADVRRAAPPKARTATRPPAVCELDANVVCTCAAKDMCDPTIKADAAATGGTLNCTFAPMSTVLATFDRLLDTTPFEAEDARSPRSRRDADDARRRRPPTTRRPARRRGSSSRISSALANGSAASPSRGDPALPTGATVTFALDKANVLAKDGKTPFTGNDLLADGIIAFKTAAFAASITVPAPPPPPAPMDMGGAMMPMGGPDAGTPTQLDGRRRGRHGRRRRRRRRDAAASERQRADGGTDAARTPARARRRPKPASPTRAARRRPARAAARRRRRAVDRRPSRHEHGRHHDHLHEPRAGMDVLAHITITEDGKPFTDFDAVDGPGASRTPTVTLMPETTWAAGKTYEVTVDAERRRRRSAKTLGAPASRCLLHHERQLRRPC